MNKNKIKRIILSILMISIISVSFWAVAETATGGKLTTLFSREVTNEVETSESINNSKESVLLPVNSFSDTTSLVGITLDELSKHNGLNGNSAYAAVDGIVYDMTALSSWTNGEHMGLKAGTDLSDEFSVSPHAYSILKSAIIVGDLITADSTVVVLDQSNNEINKPITLSNSLEFTISELATYNGINGNKAYVAVDGIVYDMTELSSWTNGEHKGIKAGNDVTEVFASSPHSNTILNKAVIVGTLINNLVVQETKTSEVAVSNPIWSLDLLKKYNGKNGHSAYILVDGVIYDVTKLGDWSNGTHKSYSAGQDLSVAFSKSPHSRSILSAAQEVGIMGELIDIDVLNESVALTQVLISNQNDDDDNDDDNDDNDDDDNDDDDNDND